jgi:hypothetical protein
MKIIALIKHIQSVPFKTKPQLFTYKPLHAQNDETNGSVEFLQPYPMVAADALLEEGTVVISAVLPLGEHLSQQTDASCVPKFCYQSRLLFSYSVLSCQVTHC